jgi:hypothetical protein
MRSTVARVSVPAARDARESGGASRRNQSPGHAAMDGMDSMDGMNAAVQLARALKSVPLYNPQSAVSNPRSTVRTPRSAFRIPKSAFSMKGDRRFR